MYAWLLVILGCVVVTSAQNPRGPTKNITEDEDYGHRRPGMPIPVMGDINSHYCTVYDNMMKSRKVYPDCASTVQCRFCRYRRKCSGWWWNQNCEEVYNCNECCKNSSTVNEVFSINSTECCQGYYGHLCTHPKCFQPCPDNTTACTEPDTCGPACHPRCENGGTCMVGTVNTCSCPTGFSGDTCQTPATCDATNPCQNNGTCLFGVCHCRYMTYGAFCENKLCSPACLNGGTCDAQTGTCQCAPGFLGSSCQYI